MKKILITLAVILTATVSNAQIFVGGSINFGLGANSAEIGNNITSDMSNFNFSINPRIGYYLSDKLAVGGGILVGTTSNTNHLDTKSKTRGMEWGVVPFLRYSFVELGKFSVLAEATLPIRGSANSSKTGSVTVDGPTFFSLGFNIAPLLSYELSDKINLETRLNFLNFGINLRSSKTEMSDGDFKTSAIDFGFGANSDNGISFNAITVGFVYKL